ncbi:MAG: PhoU domain-containing protein [Phycisphaerales bacterium]
MPTTPEGFARRLEDLHRTLVEQGARVQSLLEEAFEAVFSRDGALADRVAGRDDEIDRVDVALEQASVQLLGDATREGAALGSRELRAVLTIVKINNEMERIADSAVAIAERAEPLRALGGNGNGRGKGVAGVGGSVPETFRVMANSVVGILRDVNRAYDRSDSALAKVVLQSEDAVEAFKAAILRDAERQIATGAMTVDLAFLLHELANECVRVADHATNIAEQVIYSVTGAIVRHTEGKWVEVPQGAGGR